MNMLPIEDPELNKLLGYLASKKEFVFLDTSRPDRENFRSFLFVDPVKRLRCRLGDDLIAFLDRLQSQLSKGNYLAGWISYEFGALLEGGIRYDDNLAGSESIILADLGSYQAPCVFDHRAGQHDFPFDAAPLADNESCFIRNIRPNMEKEEFVEAIHKIRGYIGAGDTYQVNYTLKLLFDLEGSIEDLYRTLRRNQSVCYGAYLRNSEEHILSFSPELFFRREGTEITARPMKGTAKRGRNHFEDQANRDELHDDSKNRSENVMIVDLLRNDLARLLFHHGKSRVYVDSLFDVEIYESLLQMTSTIKASTSREEIDNITLTHLFRALFPCGSITGAPKIRTMQIINELEKGPRGVYTGAIGYLAPSGSATFNVPIRTIRLCKNHGEMGVGAGITYDSNAEEEWQESLLKGKFLTHRKPQFELFETMLWSSQTGYYLLQDHLARLIEAAEYFQFSCDVVGIRARLEEKTEIFPAGYQRVRLSLAKDGRITIDSTTTRPPSTLVLPQRPGKMDATLPLVEFSSIPRKTDCAWPFYKTSMRQDLDAAFAAAQKEGLYEYLFVNEHGQITEGCITNIILYHGGRFKTPPIGCGVLPGIMRKELLRQAAGNIQEEILSVPDVHAAEAIYLCNSVRGVVRVALRAAGN